MELDWAKLFGLEKPLIEVVLRGSIVYLAIFALLTAVRNREGGNLSMNNMLVLVLMAGASHHALTGESYSITEGLLLVGIISFWSWTVDVLSYHVPPLRRLIRRDSLPVVQGGRLLEKNLEREALTEEELMSALRLHGVERLEEVKLASIEPHGEISVIRYDSENRKARQRRAV